MSLASLERWDEAIAAYRWAIVSLILPKPASC